MGAILFQPQFVKKKGSEHDMILVPLAGDMA